MEGVQKDIRLVQEQVETAKLQANQERKRAEESAQTLVACEGKLVTSIEERQKLSQANAMMSKELTDAHQLIQEGFAKLVEASKEATKRVR